MQYDDDAYHADFHWNLKHKYQQFYFKIALNKQNLVKQIRISYEKNYNFIKLH